MLGLHPEDVKADWRDVLTAIKPELKDVIAIGEVGLDYYWSREFEKEQLEAFDEMAVRTNGTAAMGLTWLLTSSERISFSTHSPLR